MELQYGINYSSAAIEATNNSTDHSKRDEEGSMLGHNIPTTTTTGTTTLLPTFTRLLLNSSSISYVSGFVDGCATSDYPQEFHISPFYLRTRSEQ